MCVICVKRASQKMPSMEKVEAMWRKNPDGAGVMWRYNGKVGFSKGFMKLESLKRYLSDNAKALAPLDVALHFRIGTHGGNTSGNTHPFVMDKRADPHRQECIAGTSHPLLMHNGVLPVVPRRDDISDTAELAMRAGAMKSPIKYLRSISELLRGNRVVVFTTNGVEFYGDAFQKGDDGLLYSNLNHEKTWWQDELFYDAKWYTAGTWTPKHDTTAKGGNKAEPERGGDYTPPKYLGAKTANEEGLAKDAEEIVAEIYGLGSPLKMSGQDLRLFRLEYAREIYDTYEMLIQEEEENAYLAAAGC